MTDGQKKLPLLSEVQSGQTEQGSSACVAGRNVDRLEATGEGPLKKLVDRNFLQYASYVIRDRAIPDLDDGLKPVQRRILFSLLENDDGKFIKVANIVGFCMQFHPHGDASIEEARPDSIYAYKAKEMLAKIPERFYSQYHITPEELDTSMFLTSKAGTVPVRVKIEGR